jgi:hypothetical protein
MEHEGKTFSIISLTPNIVQGGRTLTCTHEHSYVRRKPVSESRQIKRRYPLPANRMTQKTIHEKLPSAFDAENSDDGAEWL